MHVMLALYAAICASNCEASLVGCSPASRLLTKRSLAADTAALSCTLSCAAVAGPASCCCEGTDGSIQGDVPNSDHRYFDSIRGTTHKARVKIAVNFFALTGWALYARHPYNLHEHIFCIEIEFHRLAGRTITVFE